jgi:hypothetical protein
MYYDSNEKSFQKVTFTTYKLLMYGTGTIYDQKIKENVSCHTGTGIVLSNSAFKFKLVFLFRLGFKF